MRAALLCLALTALAACGTGEPAPQIGPSNPRHVQFYQGSLPRCPVRDVGTVRGRNWRELRNAAMSLRAHAVILERRGPNDRGPYEGSAVVFVREGCYE